MDYKTGNFQGDDAWLQMAPYVVMLEKMSGEPCAGAIVIHTAAQTRSGIPGLATIVRTREELKADYEDYRHVAALWERRNAGAMPRLFDFPSLITLEQKENDRANAKTA